MCLLRSLWLSFKWDNFFCVQPRKKYRTIRSWPIGTTRMIRWSHQLNWINKDYEVSILEMVWRDNIYIQSHRIGKECFYEKQEKSKWTAAIWSHNWTISELYSPMHYRWQRGVEAPPRSDRSSARCRLREGERIQAAYNNNNSSNSRSSHTDRKASRVVVVVVVVVLCCTMSVWDWSLGEIE